MEPKQIKDPVDYDRHNLNMRAAEFYHNLRKSKSEWKSIEDLGPQLSEFKHLVAAEAYGRAFEVLEEFWHYPFVWGEYECLVKMRLQLLGKLQEPLKRVINKGNLGLTYTYMGKLKEALEYSEKALSEAGHLDEPLYKGRFLTCLGFARCVTGQFAAGLPALEEALRIAREVDDKLYEAAILNNLGWISLNFQRDAVKAREFNEQAAKIFKELAEGDELDIWGFSVYSLCNSTLGQAYSVLGHEKKAAEFLHQSVDTARQVNDLFVELYALGTLGDVYRCMLQPKQAMKHYQEALDRAGKIGAGIQIVRNIGSLGNLYRDLGFFRLLAGDKKQGKEALNIALKHFEEGMETGKRLGLDSDVGTLEGRKGNVSRELGDHNKALLKLAGAAHDKALEMAEKEGPAAGIHTQLDRARDYYFAGDRQEAGRRFERALTSARTGIALARDRYENEARAEFGLGVVLLGGKAGEAVTSCSTAEEAFKSALGHAENWLDELEEIEIARRSKVLYLQATSLAGLSVCPVPRKKQDEYRHEAEKKFHEAFDFYKAPSLLRDTFRDLREIKGTAAGPAEKMEHFIDLIRRELAKSINDKDLTPDSYKK